MTRPTDSVAELRIDKWLWCARFYKSRSLATAAVNGGKVHVNDERAKASRGLRVGDQLTITQGALVAEIEVSALPQRRGPANEARACYVETAASIARREHFQAQHRLAALSTPRPESRPDKRSRRQLIDLNRRQRDE